MTNIRKVGALAGVSIATVSRALKKPEQVAPKTREKVLKAVEEAGYRPNWLATSIKEGKSKSILVLVPNLINAFFLRIIAGVERAAQEQGYTVLLGDIQGSTCGGAEYARMALTSRTDGLIQLGHSFPFSQEDAALGEKVPMVSVCDRIDGEYAYPFIQLDNYAAGRAVAHHLVAYSHVRMGAIVGQIDSSIYRDRIGGFKSVLQEEGIALSSDFLVGGEYSLEEGVRGVKELMSFPEPPTALFCFSDDIAIGAIHQLLEMGLRVPEDVSVVGFDNTKVAPYIKPPLTTIDQPAYEMGCKAVNMLFCMMHGEVMPRTREIMQFRLVERASTGPVKA